MEPYWDLVERIICESDLVLEVLDARLVELSRNERVEELVKKIGRPLVFVVNKSDLVSSKRLKGQVRELREKGDVIFISTKSPKDIRIILQVIKKVFKNHGKREIIPREKGEPKLKIREAKGDIIVGILGYPNVGKSSIINALTHKKKVKVSKKSGTTHGIHWVRGGSGIKFIDSPGVIPLVKEDEIKYGLIGAKDNERLKNPALVAHAVIKLFMEKGIVRLYGFELNEDIDSVIERIGHKKGFLLKGSKVDENRVCSMIVKDWQEGRLRL